MVRFVITDTQLRSVLNNVKSVYDSHCLIAVVGTDRQRGLVGGYHTPKKCKKKKKKHVSTSYKMTGPREEKCDDHNCTIHHGAFFFIH